MLERDSSFSAARGESLGLCTCFEMIALLSAYEHVYIASPVACTAIAIEMALVVVDVRCSEWPAVCRLRLVDWRTLVHEWL